VHRLRISLPSSKASINGAVNRIMGIAVRCSINEDKRTDLEIALREALANAVTHGNEFGADKRVFVRCYGSPQLGVLVLVRDEGRGFRPEEVPDPRDEDRIHLTHGRGLFLMRALLDFVEHRKSGCEVVLFKKSSEEG